MVDACGNDLGASVDASWRESTRMVMCLIGAVLDWSRLAVEGISKGHHVGRISKQLSKAGAKLALHYGASLALHHGASLLVLTQTLQEQGIVGERW